jgi:hypothetical protein
MAASPGFAPGLTESEAVVLLVTLRGKGKWSPGKVLPPRLLGVGQTRSYFTTGRLFGARDRICTCAVDVLNVVPLLDWAARAKVKRYPGKDSNLQPCTSPVLPAYKAVALPIELPGHGKWRNAVGLHHNLTKCGSICLANSPGSLVRLAFLVKVVGVGRLALPRLFGFEPNRSAVPGKPHAGRRHGSGLPKSCKSAAPEKTFASRKAKHPEGSAILSRCGLLFPMRPGTAGNWFPELELHQHMPLQRRPNCFYSIRESWGPWSDSHRRIWVYKTSPRRNGIP